MLFKIAWRNISRNRRRSGITIAAIFFAVVSSVFMNSMERGTWDRMIENVVNFHIGYIQVHQKGYWEDQSLDMAFECTKELEQKFNSIPDVKSVIPRLEGYALAYNYSDTSSMGVLLVGTDPELENSMSELKQKVVSGTFINKNDKSVLVAEGLAKQLNLMPGDSITLVSQGYHGANAAAVYPVKGIVKFGSPDLNKQLVYLPLSEAQYFFEAKDLVSNVILNVKARLAVNSTLKKAQAMIDSSKFEIMGWEELLPELVQARDMDTTGNIIPLGILYTVIAFGIFGTVLMMTKERQYEFGVLTAIGMSRAKLAFTVWLETTFLGLLGVLIGIALAAIPVFYYHYYPIRFGEAYAETFAKFGMDPLLATSTDLKLFTDQALIVFIMNSFLALYPLYKILRLKPLEAMRS
jgi:ABC-type lipoprotein release transport system permease subunit